MCPFLEEAGDAIAAGQERWSQQDPKETRAPGFAGTWPAEGLWFQAGPRVVTAAFAGYQAQASPALGVIKRCPSAPRHLRQRWEMV